jgi:CDP-glucose 4,6-dehydratase
MRNEFWKNKKVLITGYEGFLGSHLTGALLNEGAKLCGLDIRIHRKETVLSGKELNKINIIKGNVENFSLVSKILKENKIEYIFHLAAKSLVGECLQKPVKAFSTNIKGTWNVLEASRGNNRIKSIIISSSDKAYGSHKDLPYKEDAPLSGAHPYDVSKSSADLIAYTYYHTYGVPVAVTRCGNIFGPGDFNFSRIVPDAVRCAIADRPVLIRSDGKFTRDYIYIEDIVAGYVGLAEKMGRLKLFGEAFNFSNEEPISVLGVVKKVYELSAKDPSYKILGRAKHEIKHQHLSSRKARRILAWKPKSTMDKGLSKTIKWYRDYFSSKAR